MSWSENESKVEVLENKEYNINCIQLDDSCSSLGAMQTEFCDHE